MAGLGLGRTPPDQTMKIKTPGSGERARTDTMFAAAMARHRAGDIDAAARAYGEILRIAPRHTNAMHFLGLARHQQGNLVDAAHLMAESIALNPGVAAYFGNFASLCSDLGWTTKAIECYRRLTVLAPNDPIPFLELGRLALSEQRTDEAAAALRDAARRAPDAVDVLAAIGELQHEAGFYADALTSLQRLHALAPDNPQALNHLGGVLAAIGRTDEAISCYRLAIARQPDMLAARNNLGLAYLANHELDKAEEAFRDAIRIDPAYARAYSNLGIALRLGGCLEESIASLRSAIRIAPSYAKAQHNLLFALNASEAASPAALAAEHRAFGERFEAAVAPPIAAPSVVADPDRKLRIAYVSGDLRKHPVGFFLEAIFAHHDPSRSEIFCYSSSPATDELTEALRCRTQAWQDCSRLDDTALADRIRADRIDILVDLAGHTEHNRLLSFALKPAPVQATYLGYANTTGMRSIDFRLTDALADPPGSESLSSEQLIRLPHSYFCYRPRPDAPAVQPPPARANGFVTFGACLNYAKASPTTHALWAAVLDAVAGSRLILRASGFTDAATRQRAGARFAALGIDAARLELLPHAPFPRHLETYDRIDIGLDTFPFNLATNAVEALWQGVPFVTLAGDTSPARMGLSILTAAGLPELAASTRAEFVDIAVRLAANPDRLAELRASMRSRLAASPLLDGAAKARDLEAAYRSMWQTYCRDAGQR